MRGDRSPRILQTAQQPQQQLAAAGMLSAGGGGSSGSSSSATAGLTIPDINALLMQQKLLDAQRLLTAGGANVGVNGDGGNTNPVAALLAALQGGGVGIGGQSGKPAAIASEENVKRNGGEIAGAGGADAGSLSGFLASRIAGNGGGGY